MQQDTMPAKPDENCESTGESFKVSHSGNYIIDEWGQRIPIFRREVGANPASSLLRMTTLDLKATLLFNCLQKNRDQINAISDLIEKQASFFDSDKEVVVFVERK